MDGGNPDERRGQLNLQQAGIDVRKPFRLIGMAFQSQPGNERIVSADDHQDQEVRDHDLVHQSQDGQHDLGLGQFRRAPDQMNQLDDEMININALGQDEPEVEGRLEPAAQKNKTSD